MHVYGYFSFAAGNLRRCYFFYAVNDFLLCTGTAFKEQRK